jgi:hypothetical protein
VVAGTVQAPVAPRQPGMIVMALPGEQPLTPQVPACRRRFAMRNQ